jgi:hypothetical protein
MAYLQAHGRPTRRQSLIVLGSAALSPLSAQENSAPQQLFDGKSLSGWQVRQGPDTAFYAEQGAIVVHPGSNFPAWLASPAQYENFDWSGEVFLQGWANGGLYFSAPAYGPPADCGFKVNIFHKKDNPPLRESAGAIFPHIAPSQVTVNGKAAWNTFRIRLDWPSLRVWWNGEMVQDLKLDQHPEMKYRLRRGHLGIESLSYPLRYRNFQIKPLPGKEKWDVLYGAPADLGRWTQDGKATWEALGDTLRADGLGYLITKERYQDFALESYIRTSLHSNGGVLFRGGEKGADPHYEIQLHDVEGAVYPTGSLYGLERAQPYPRIRAEEWYLFQLFVQGKQCTVRINGETVVDCAKLERSDAGTILLQAHQQNRWIEYKGLRVKRI